MELNEDKILYKEFLNGNEKAFEKIIEKYRRNVVYFIFRYVQDLDVAEDIFHDVVLYILERKEQYKFDYSFRAYLYMIAKSRSLNYLKQHKIRNTVELNEKLYIEEKLLEDVIEHKERNNMLNAIINELNPEYKMVTYLCMVEELSYEEASIIMGKTPSQIKNLLHRARIKLRKKLVEEKFVEISKNKNIKMFVSILILVFITATVVYAITNYMNNKKQATLTPTFTGEISSIDFNTLWVGTFQLAWNELKDKVGQDIVFEENTPNIVNELNKESFTSDMLSSNSYYVKADKTTSSLKEEIENDLKGKNLLSGNVLEEMEFTEDANSYTIYALLQKEFEFKHPFDRLPNEYFGDNTEIKVQYFGITSDSNLKLFENMEVLFFNNEEHFAIKLLTQNDEEIILLKDNNNKSFNELYDTIQEQTKVYNGRRELQEGDQLKIPFIEIDTIINYDELCGKIISGTKNKYIQSALQNVRFYLNEKGGYLKSEASIKEISRSSYIDYLNLDFSSNFYIFMKEENKSTPYMALKVDNIDILVEAENN